MRRGCARAGRRRGLCEVPQAPPSPFPPSRPARVAHPQPGRPLRPRPLPPAFTLPTGRRPPGQPTAPVTKPSLNAWQILALALTAYASEPNPAQSRYKPARRAAPPTRPPTRTASQKPASGHLTAIFRQFRGVWYDAPMNTITNDSEPSRPWLFKPGNNANPRGRPPGTVGGRVRALQILDKITGDEDNVKLLAAAFEAAFRKNPMQFFQKVMRDLIPRESLVKIAAATPTMHHWGTLEDSMRETQAQRENLRALRAEFPGRDSEILDLIVEKNCPIAALRIQMNSPRLPAPECPAER